MSQTKQTEQSSKPPITEEKDQMDTTVPLNKPKDEKSKKSPKLKESKKARQLIENKEKQPDDRDNVRVGMVVKVHEKIIDTTPKGEKRERIQIYKGMVIARKHGKEHGATITVRKQSGEVNVEKIFPIYSPLITQIVIDKIFKVRRSKLYFLRNSKKRLREIK